MPEEFKYIMRWVIAYLLAAPVLYRVYNAFSENTILVFISLITSMILTYTMVYSFEKIFTCESNKNKK